jgi:hypothetical protein
MSKLDTEHLCAWCLWECDCGRPVCKQGRMELLPGVFVNLCAICAMDRASAIAKTAGSRETAKELGLA